MKSHKYRELKFEGNKGKRRCDKEFKLKTKLKKKGDSGEQRLSEAKS